MKLEPGDSIDRYVVDGDLGEGGMATVYRVHHRTLRTPHALKLLSIVDSALQERLIEEGRVQAHLKHPNIVSVSDVIEYQGRPGLVMEFVDGPPMDLWLHHYRPTLDEALTLFRGILAGVGAAHEQGLVHRDLKPGNVLLQITDKGLVPRVADFGLVKSQTGMTRTRSGTTMGTPAYMAPEQLRDASKVDRRADMYSLGVILYELVTGQLPYYDDDLIELIKKLASGDRVPAQEIDPSIPDAVARTIDMLLRIDPDERTADCATALKILGGQDPMDLTLSLNYAGDDTLPKPMKMPDDVGEARLPSTSPGSGVAKGLASELREASTKRSDAPELTNETMDFTGEASLRPKVDTVPASTRPTQPVQPSPSGSVPTQKRRGWGLWLLGAGLSVSIVGILAVVVTVIVAASLAPLDREQPVDDELVAPVLAPASNDVAQPQPATASEPKPSTEPEPAPNPAVVAPASKPSVRVRPTPKPAAVPSPVSAAPEPAEPEPAPVIPGRFSVQRRDDGVGEVVLANTEHGSLGEGDPIPPGTYTIIATFSGVAPQEMAQKVTVAPGETVTLRCAAFRTICVKQ